MVRSGYVKLYRSIKDNFLWKDKPFTKGQAWVDIMIEANHADGGFFKRGVWVDVKRGQDGRSEITLSTEWGWSRGKVRRFLATLKKERMIELKQDNKTTIITICNYEGFQGKDKESSTPNGTADSTPNGHQTDTKRYTNKNEKNNKNVKNKKTFVENSDEYRLAKLLSDLMIENNQENKISIRAKEDNYQKWSDEVRKMHEIDKRSFEQIEYLIQWSQKDPFWSSNILSPKTLRDKFDSLVLRVKEQKEKKQPQVNKKPAVRTLRQMVDDFNEEKKPQMKPLN